MEAASPELDIEWVVHREDPMLIHYTSGSTGKPKGVLHVHNAMIQHYQTGNGRGICRMMTFIGALPTRAG